MSASPPDYWKKAQKELSAACPTMRKIIKSYDGHLVGKGDPFLTLARSIVGQQISVRAADSVWRKYEALLGKVTPKATLAQSEEALRACGLSRQKITYLTEISHYFAQNKVKAGYFDAMSDGEVIGALTSIKGIGRWTAEMFLMFHLLRPDVLPLVDIGLQRGIERHYNAGIKMTKKQHDECAKPWQPWRSVATWYLWRSLDPVAVEY